MNIKEFVLMLNDWVTNFAQIFATIVIFFGIVRAFGNFFKELFTPRGTIETLEETRLELGYSFSLGLSFLIGSSILKTMVAPSWNEIGQLSVIILIRTVLNYFLTVNIKNAKEKEEISCEECADTNEK